MSFHGIVTSDIIEPQNQMIHVLWTNDRGPFLRLILIVFSTESCKNTSKKEGN